MRLGSIRGTGPNPYLTVTWKVKDLITIQTDSSIYHLISFNPCITNPLIYNLFNELSFFNKIILKISISEINLIN